MNYYWKEERNDIVHFVRSLDGKILGTVWQYVNNPIVWSSKILEDEFPFTDSSEKFLGRYINSDSAKKSVEKFWQRQDNTLLNEITIKGVIDAS
jgi:hypothetical protein